MLKGHRNYSLGNDIEVSYFMAEAADAGIIVVHDTGTVTQPALDDTDNKVTIPTSGDDGVPVGLLLCNVLDYDPEEVIVPRFNTDALVNEKVQIARAGWFVTDKLKVGDTPIKGDEAYYAASGLFSTSGTHQVGEFESEVDADGFFRVRIKLN